MNPASTGPGRPASHVVHVWHAHVDVLRRDPDAERRALAWLTPTEAARYDRYRRDTDREMFLLGRIIARAVVGDALGVPPRGWPWREGVRGRPEIDIPHCPIGFNIAHSGGLVACALSRHGAVGVDVEDRARPSLDHDLVARCCSIAERADINNRGPEGWRDRFLQYWTLKEAYLKARGLGISVHLPDLSFSLRHDRVQLEGRGSMADAVADWTFELITLHADHYLAVAAQDHAGLPAVFRFDPFPAAWLP
jgi:4'-phosphopantetheinyl transferase